VLQWSHLLCGPFFVGRGLTIALFLILRVGSILARIVDLAALLSLLSVRWVKSASSMSTSAGTTRRSSRFGCDRETPEYGQWTVAYVAGLLLFLYSFIRVTSMPGIRISLALMKKEDHGIQLFRVSRIGDHYL